MLAGCGTGETDHTSGCSNGICGNSSSGGGGATNAYLKIENMERSYSKICSIYCTLSTTNSWGSNLLTERMSPGYSTTITLPQCNTEWDFKVVYCDGTEPPENLDYYFGCGKIYTFSYSDH